MKKILIVLAALALLAPSALAVSRDEAANIAQNATGGAQVERVERDGGTYEVTLSGDGARYRVEVSNAGGAVLEVETVYTGAGRGTRFALSEAEAREAAANVTPEAAGGLVTRERDSEGSAYEVFYASGGSAGEISVNAETGAILRVTTYPEAARQGVLNLEEIAARLADKLPGARLAELELEWDGSRYLYEGEAVAGDQRYEFEMNAVTGKIVEFERAD